VIVVLSLGRSWFSLCSLAVLAAQPSLAYTPGSGSIYSANFETLDADWENGNNIADSPWTQVTDGPDKSFYADGKGTLPNSPTHHRAKHFAHPVDAATYSMAFEYRAELGASYTFDLVVQQRAPALRAYKLNIDGNGALSIWRTEGGMLVKKVNTANGVIPANMKRWVRFAIEPDGPAGQFVRVRVWSGSATSEPTTWTLSYQDPVRTIERAHRFELFADGPRNIETWIDDLDCFGDGAAGTASTITKIYIVEWSHLDIGFTEPPDEIEAFAKSHLDLVLANLQADPNYKFTIESAWWLDRWWERSTDSQRQNMVSWLQSGRLVLTAGYASLHTTVAGHEQLTRNLYYASKFARDHNVPLRTWITDDVPGSSYALPELLKRAGIEYFAGGMNTPFGGVTTLPNQGTRPFWWQGPDGSKVLSWTTFDSYAEAFNWGFSFFDTLPNIWTNTGRELPKLEEAGYPYAELLLMRAFDNHYQDFHVRNLVNQWNATYQTPKFELATVEQFMDLMVQKYGANSFPTYSGDFGAAWSSSHAGYPNSTAWIRQAHRQGRAAEALLGASSVVGGGAVPHADVELMYRRMLEFDEHSGAGGWPGYFTPEEMDRNNRAHLQYAVDAREKSNELASLGLQRLTAPIPASADAIVVVNSLIHERSAWVRAVLAAPLFASDFRLVDRVTNLELPYQKLNASSEILFRADALPSLGYRVYDLIPGAPTAVPTGMLTVTATQLENDFYRVTVDPSDGSLTSVFEKGTGRELIDTASAYRFNRLASNTSNEINGGNNPAAQSVGSANVTIGSTGPLVVELRVSRTGTPHTGSVYRLYRAEDRVEFENTIDKSQTPYIPNTIGTRAYFVTLPFDVHNFQVRSETTTKFLDPVGDAFARPNYFDWYNTEHTLQFWDNSGGVLYACDASNSHFFEKLKGLPPPNRSLTNALLLPRMFDRGDEYEYEGGTIGSYEMEPGAPTVYTFTHHIKATPAGFDAAAASRFGFNTLTPPKATVIGPRPGTWPSDRASLVSHNGANVAVYTVKGAEDGNGLIVRLLELAGNASTTVQLSSDLISFGNALRVEQDEEGGTPLTTSAGVVSVPLGPYETATVRIAIQPIGNVALTVTKNTTDGTVELDWSGGGPSYALRRAEDPEFTIGNTTLQSGPGTSFDDPVLNDGKTYFYVVD
jgi:hypothetical protein